MFLHVGFETATPEIMAAWEAWFASFADRQVAQGGFAGGREISKDGIQELPWGRGALTGYNIIGAEDLDEATQLAEACPYIDSIRVYELREM